MRVFVIAEIGVNHNGSVALARRMIRAAARAGADAVKFQSFDVSRLLVKGTAKADYQARQTGGRESQDDMLRRLVLDRGDFVALKQEAKRARVEFLASPFDEKSLAGLVRLGVRRLKLPSGEITNGPFLLAAARTGLPLLLSTGMASLGEVEEALAVLAHGYRQPRRQPTRQRLLDALSGPKGWDTLRDRVTLLHCTTQYPTPMTDVNLRAMQTLHAAFGLPIGYSDHTGGTAIALAAVALGARVIEKHLTLDRGLPGPDHQASLEPGEFGVMVEGIRQIEEAIGSGRKTCTPGEQANRSLVRKSLVTAAPMRTNERWSDRTLAAKRPGTGRSPMDYWDVVGTPAARDMDVDDVV